MPFMKIDYDGEFPKYIESFDGVFYYTDFDTLYLSDNGIYFEKFNPGYDIITLDKIGDEILVNNRERIKIPTFEKLPVIALNNEIMGFSHKPVLKDGEYFISARKILEKCDCDVIYNEETGEITVKKVFLTASAKIGDTKCTKNGTDYEIGAPFVSEGEIYLPIEFFEKIMDFKCEKNEDINFIRFVS